MWLAGGVGVGGYDVGDPVFDAFCRLRMNVVLFVENVVGVGVFEGV